MAEALGLLVAVVVGLALFELGSWECLKRKEEEEEEEYRRKPREKERVSLFLSEKEETFFLKRKLFTVVVRELQEARPAEHVLEPVPLVRGQRRLPELEEVEREPLRLERQRRREPHPEDARVKGQGPLRVLDAEHRLLELEAARGLRAVGVDALRVCLFGFRVG